MNFQFESASVISDKGRRWRHAMDVCQELQLECLHAPAVFLDHADAQMCTSHKLTKEHGSFTKGAIGAYMAHQQVWRNLSTSANPNGWHLIFEDDVSLPDLATAEVQEEIATTMENASRAGHNFVQLGGSELHAYAIKPSAAARLSSISLECGHIERPVQHLASDACIHNDIDCAPAVVNLPNRSHTRTSGILKQLKRTNDNPSQTLPFVRDQQRLLD